MVVAGAEGEADEELELNGDSVWVLQEDKNSGDQWG